MNPSGHGPIDDTARLRRKIIGTGKVLQRAVTDQWELSPEQWDRFDGYLDAIDSALASIDAEGVKSATAEIVRLEPRRAIKLGSAGGKSLMSEPTHDRINVIVHRIDRLAAEAADGDETSPPGGA
jgi:hypothetical protein